MVSIKKILPMEVNLEIKNFTEYLKPANIDLSQATSKSRAFLLDAASYDNLGDQAITYAISLFLRDLFGEDCYVEISERDLLRNLKYLKKTIRAEDVLCLNGGGNMGNLYPRYESLRRKVIKKFPNNKIIIFPQTIDYESDSYGKRELERSRKVYNSHNNLIVCAREKNSYRIMRELYANVMLVPDIVFYLKGKLKLADRKNNGNKIGLCIRKDKEGIVPDSFFQEMEEILLKEKFSITHTTTISSGGQSIKFEKERLNKITAKLNEFSQYDCVITDRLHGMIFSILADVPCVVFDNKNHKVAEVYRMLKEKTSIKNVILVDFNSMDVGETVRTVMENADQKLCSYDWFESLKETLKAHV